MTGRPLFQAVIVYQIGFPCEFKVAQFKWNPLVRLSEHLPGGQKYNKELTLLLLFWNILTKFTIYQKPHSEVNHKCCKPCSGDVLSLLIGENVRGQSLLSIWSFEKSDMSSPSRSSSPASKYAALPSLISSLGDISGAFISGRSELVVIFAAVVACSLWSWLKIKSCHDKQSFMHFLLINQPQLWNTSLKKHTLRTEVSELRGPMLSSGASFKTGSIKLINNI